MTCGDKSLPAVRAEMEEDESGNTVGRRLFHMPDILEPEPKMRASTIGSALLTGFHALGIKNILNYH